MFSLMVSFTLFLSPAFADLAPEPAEESTDTSTEDTGEGSSDEKSGCSSTGANIGLSMLPVVLIGLVTLARSREEN